MTDKLPRVSLPVDCTDAEAFPEIARARAHLAAMDSKKRAELEEGLVMSDWQPIETCPQDGKTYVLFRFPPGSSADRECPNVAVGKRYAARDDYWLTAIWAASTAHTAPDAWMPLPKVPA